MREIAFRVWSKEKSKMYYGGFAISISSGLYNPPGREIDLRGCPVEQEKYVIMQFTGLYDHTKWEDLSKEEQKRWLESGKTEEEWKGRKVYEGDVVLVKYIECFEEGEEVLWEEAGVVFFDDKTGKFVISEIGVKHGPYSFDELEDMDEYEWGVIGNVFENPELVKKYKLEDIVKGILNKRNTR